MRNKLGKWVQISASQMGRHVAWSWPIQQHRGHFCDAQKEKLKVYAMEGSAEGSVWSFHFCQGTWKGTHAAHRKRLKATGELGQHLYEQTEVFLRWREGTVHSFVDRDRANLRRGSWKDVG